jgi:MFS family permease
LRRPDVPEVRDDLPIGDVRRGVADRRAAWYALGVLLFAYVFAFLDRQVINLLVGPIRQTFGVSDVQIGLLQGAAFSVAYAFAGLPIAWLGDRYDRRRIIVVGMVLWSSMTVLSSLATSYNALFAARVGVGIGEAALAPAAAALLGELFEKDEMPRVLGLYNMAIFIGSGIAQIMGGLALRQVGEDWRSVFVLIGLPSLCLAPLILTIRSPPPRRHRAEAKPGPKPSLIGFLASRRLVCLGLYIGGAASTAMGFADNWAPELYARRFEIPVSTAAQWLGAVSLTAGPLGLIVGSTLAAWMIRRGRKDGCLLMLQIAAALVLLAACLMPLADVAVAALAASALIKLSVGLTPVLIVAAIQSCAPPGLTTRAIALSYIVSSLLGAAGGPLLIAVLADRLFPTTKGLVDAYSMGLGLLATASFALFALARPAFRRAVA